MTQEFERQLEIAKHEQQLAELRAKEAADKAALAEAQKRVNEAAHQRQEQAFSQNLQRELEGAGLQPNENFEQSDLEAILRSSFKFEIANDGTFRVKSGNGQYVDSGDALRGWASDPKHRKYFSQHSLRLLETPPDKLCKSEMSTQMKTAYISRHGLEAYSALPFNPPVAEVSPDQMTAELWGKLPVSRRSQLLSERGEEWLSEMLRATRTRR
jgi:hypothetical protein